MDIRSYLNIVSEADRNQGQLWRAEADAEMAQDPDSPYYVAWSGQSHEWSGSGSPESGDGRYKPRGDGGALVAVNIADRQDAEAIANDLDDSQRAGLFADPAVYAQWGRDHYLVDYQGAYVGSMRDLDDYYRDTMASDQARGLVRDYGK